MQSTYNVRFSFTITDNFNEKVDRLIQLLKNIPAKTASGYNIDLGSIQYTQGWVIAPDNPSNDGLSGGAIAAAIVVPIVALVLAFVLYRWLRARNSPRNNYGPASDSMEYSRQNAVNSVI